MDQLLVALDVETAGQARDLAKSLRGVVGGFKVGKQLFTSEGPALVRELVERGDRVFLDLKFHDIPNTVAGAVTSAVRLGVWMVDVHASGGVAMMRAAYEAAHAEAARQRRPAPLVIGITVLTSLDDKALRETGVGASVSEQVTRLAALAQEAGLDGVVASPHEVALIRKTCGASFVVVTPGVRAADDAKGDQQRTASAADALSWGATYLVVGRPITASSNPRQAAERIAADGQITQRG